LKERQTKSLEENESIFRIASSVTTYPGTRGHSKLGALENNELAI